MTLLRCRKCGSVFKCMHEPLPGGTKKAEVSFRAPIGRCFFCNAPELEIVKMIRGEKK